MHTTAIAALVALVAASPGPQEAVEEDTGLSGQVELGIVSTSGNTETRSWNLNGELLYAAGPWEHEGSVRYLRTSDAEATTADRTLVRGESRRAISDRDFVFVALRYERDRFSGFDYRVTERLGYGRDLLVGEPLAWEFEVGLGSRQSRELEVFADGVVTGGGSTTEFIGAVATALTWTISDTARLTEEVSVDGGSGGTVSQSITALTADLVSDFALRLSFDAKHTSEVPPDRDKLDTVTSATLVFSF